MPETNEEDKQLTPGEQAFHDVATLFDSMEDVTDPDSNIPRRRKILTDGTEIQTEFFQDVYGLRVKSNGKEAVRFQVGIRGLESVWIDGVRMKLGEQRIKTQPIEMRDIKDEKFFNAAGDLVEWLNGSINQESYTDPTSLIKLDQVL